MYIKMDGYTIPDSKIKKEGYSVKLENTYSQAKRTNTLLMVKILIGKVYTLNVTLINITSVANIFILFCSPSKFVNLSAKYSSL